MTLNPCRFCDCPDCGIVETNVNDKEAIAAQCSSCGFSSYLPCRFDRMTQSERQQIEDRLSEIWNGQETITK